MQTFKNEQVLQGLSVYFCNILCFDGSIESLMANPEADVWGWNEIAVRREIGAKPPLPNCIIKT